MIRRTISTALATMMLVVLAAGTASAEPGPTMCVTNGFTTPSSICVW